MHSVQLEPLAFVLGAVVAAAGYGAGRRRPSGLSAMGAAVADLQSRTATLDDALLDAMRQSLEGRESLQQRLDALEARVSSEEGSLRAEQELLRDRLEMLEGQVSGVGGAMKDVSGAFEEQRQTFEELRQAFGELRETSAAQQSVWGELDQQLSEMQAFIVRTADEAAKQRQALQAPIGAPQGAAMPPAVAPPVADVEAMLRELTAQQQEFQRRQQQRQGEAL